MSGIPNTPGLEPIIPRMEQLDPWFDDGNIVLSCGGASGFRVHRSVLARHSEVFRNLFADAAADTAWDNSSLVEGCPVIPLSDTAEDCQNLMRALYHGRQSFKMRNMNDFLHISSLLQSATKYGIDWLRNKAIAYIGRYWPHTLQEWRNLAKSSHGKTVHPALVINLARKVDVPVLLPLALYRLGLFSTPQAHEVKLASSAGPISESAYQLFHEDCLNHLRYRDHASLSARSFVEEFLEPFVPQANCQSKILCSETFGRIASEVRGGFLESVRPISFMEAAVAYAEKTQPCPTCKEYFIIAVREQEQVLWDALPGWFGLPDWDVLKANLVPEDEL